LADLGLSAVDLAALGLSADVELIAVSPSAGASSVGGSASLPLMAAGVGPTPIMTPVTGVGVTEAGVTEVGVAEVGVTEVGVGLLQQSPAFARNVAVRTSFITGRH
jgi:hypothetical protein